MKVTDDQSLAENLGKRGGWTVPAPIPTEAEIRERCEIVRRSWADPLLRLELGLSDPIPNTERHHIRT